MPFKDPKLKWFAPTQKMYPAKGLGRQKKLKKLPPRVQTGHHPPTLFDYASTKSTYKPAGLASRLSLEGSLDGLFIPKSPPVVGRSSHILRSTSCICRSLTSFLLTEGGGA